MSEAARELSKEFYPLTFTQEYISKICHGEAYSYYKDFFFNFIDDNNNIIPTNYIKKDNLSGLKKQCEEASIKVKAISPQGEVYYFNSLSEMQRQIGIERHTAGKALKE
jgi:hypothetical protein